MSVDNKSLGRFTLSGIEPSQRGLPQIEVTFSIDANGIVSVKALDKKTNQEKSITISDSGTISDEEIEKMIQEAEVNKEKDEKLKEDIKTINEAESLVGQLERTRDDKNSKLKKAQKEEIEKQINELKSLIEKRNIEKLQAFIAELNQIIAKQKNEEKEASEPSKKNDDNVVDVEETNE